MFSTSRTIQGNKGSGFLAAIREKSVKSASIVFMGFQFDLSPCYGGRVAETESIESVLSRRLTQPEIKRLKEKHGLSPFTCQLGAFGFYNFI